MRCREVVEPECTNCFLALESELAEVRAFDCLQSNTDTVDGEVRIILEPPGKCAGTNIRGERRIDGEVIGVRILDEITENNKRFLLLPIILGVEFFPCRIERSEDVGPAGWMGKRSISHGLNLLAGLLAKQL